MKKAYFTPEIKTLQLERNLMDDDILSKGSNDTKIDDPSLIRSRQFLQDENGSGIFDTTPWEKW